MSLPKNLTGLVFGRLTVLQIDRTKTRRSWLCSCSCGGQKVVAQGDLLRGDTESCGCIKRERLAAMSKMGKVDHDTLTVGAKRAYRKWTYMWNRVRNPAGKSICYADVTVCEDWKNFYLFHRDMGEPPVGQSLDRIDKEKGYSADNCRWVPLVKQAQNTRTNKIVTIDGSTDCISEQARRFGLEPDVVFDRVNKLGWTVERALKTKKRLIRRRAV